LHWVGFKDTPDCADAGNLAYGSLVRTIIDNLTEAESKFLDSQNSWFFWDIQRLNNHNLADLAEAMLATNNYAYCVENDAAFTWAELKGGSYPSGDRVTYWFLTLLIQAATPFWLQQPQDRMATFTSLGQDEPHPESPPTASTSATRITAQAAIPQAGTADPWAGGDDPWSMARAGLAGTTGSGAERDAAPYESAPRYQHPASSAAEHDVAWSGPPPYWPSWEEAQTAPGHAVGA